MPGVETCGEMSKVVFFRICVRDWVRKATCEMSERQLEPWGRGRREMRLGGEAGGGKMWEGVGKRCDVWV